MSSDLLPSPYSALSEPVGRTSRFIVTWQHPQTRAHQAVAVLDCSDGSFTFRYLRRALTVPGFQPFLGFEDVDRVYGATSLFPLFSQRVMNPNRRDFPRYLEALYLPSTASPWQILERSQGQREGDGVRVFLDPPRQDDGASESTFLVHGVRHRLAQDAGLESALAALQRGDELALVPEPGNPVEANATLVAARSERALGWVPTMLLPWVDALRTNGPIDARVVHVNGPDVPPGFRLLVRVSGRLREGQSVFTGPEWQLVAAH
jgi:hypothetical protein